MTYAPPALRDLGAYLEARGVTNLGIVGDIAHTYGYHLGRDRIYGPGGKGDADYSVQFDRDAAGLTDAAAGIDLGGDADALRKLTRWLWDECLARGAGTEDVREVIGSADGTNVFGWSSKAPNQLILNYGDATHLWHTHISYFRDTELRDKRPLFGRYFDTPPDTGTGGDMPNITAVAAPTMGTAVITAVTATATRLDNTPVALTPGGSYPYIFVADAPGPVAGILIGTDLAILDRGLADFYPEQAADCSGAVMAEYNRMKSGTKATATVTFPDPPK